MVRAHYPLIDSTRLAKGYPKEVGMQEAGELRGQLAELALTIIGDINLYKTSTPPSQGMLTNIFSEVFEPTTWDCDLDQPVLGRAIC
jgi:hypothetical protein